MSGMQHGAPRRPGATQDFETGSGRDYGTGPYRSRNGAVFGVCRGLAEYYGVSVAWTRVLII